MNITHKIHLSENLDRIVKLYRLKLSTLCAAYPILNNPFKRAGQSINIPSAEIVVPRFDYSYDDLLVDLDSLSAKYPFIKLSDIGQTVAGRLIPAVQIGQGSKEIHFNGSFHANEWITTLLLMKFLETYAQAYAEKQNIRTFNIMNIFNATSLWIVPMVNPDGVELVQKGILPNDPHYNFVMKINKGSSNFRSWKANLRGVDLNDQFPAGWETELSRRQITKPAPYDYPGTMPLSEPEAKAMAEFTLSHDFRLVMAFHTQGEEIYWGYKGFEPVESEWIAGSLRDSSHYRCIQYVQSDAGYKDWFIQQWQRPGFTIECGLGKNPLPISQFSYIFDKVIGIFLLGLSV